MSRPTYALAPGRPRFVRQSERPLQSLLVKMHQQMEETCKYSSRTSCRLLSHELQALPRLSLPQLPPPPIAEFEYSPFFCLTMDCFVSHDFNCSGKPFIHPDGSAVVYNPAGRSPQQGKTPTQQQPANHLHSQVSGRGQPSFLVPPST